MKAILKVERLAYTVPQLAAAIGVSDQQIYNHIKRGHLTPKYSGTKAIIPVSEATRFINELPEEDMGAL
ncbi:helix-turn-helix domain-containing protein [Microbacterium sp. PF5]|uniref:helix-turn-helix domain-containing protein n=1 Tax=Microbacterium sp. PF5 TaxID=2305435 RepID=UPI00109BDAE3|nr:helix-turn-helix domain-containing protein [Microbacterium sp. PF5]